MTEALALVTALYVKLVEHFVAEGSNVQPVPLCLNDFSDVVANSDGGLVFLSVLNLRFDLQNRECLALCGQGFDVRVSLQYQSF